jgi:hypothetical protein
MSKEFVEKFLKEKAEEIKKESIEEVNLVAQGATKRFEAVIEQLKRQARISLPVNILDILRSGGLVVSKDFRSEYDDAPIKVSIGDRDVFYDEWEYDRPRLKRGNYRVTLIIEKEPKT